MWSIIRSHLRQSWQYSVTAALGDLGDPWDLKAFESSAGLYSVSVTAISRLYVAGSSVRVVKPLKTHYCLGGLSEGKLTPYSVFSEPLLDRTHSGKFFFSQLGLY